MTPDISASAFRERVSNALEILDHRGDGPEDRRAQLRARHSIGKILAEILPAQAERGTRNMGQLGDAIGRSPSWIAKSREFANSYTDEELDELCLAESPLSWTHVLLLLTVSDRRMRNRLQRQATERGWSSRELHRAVHDRPGDRRGGGPRIRRPSTHVEALSRLEVETSRWLRIAGAMAEHVQSPHRGPTRQGREHADRVRDALHEMENMVSRLRGSLEQ